MHSSNFQEISYVNLPNFDENRHSSHILIMEADLLNFFISSNKHTKRFH